MLVTDMVTGTVQHMLHLTPNKEIFPKAEHGPQSVEWIEQKVCKETNEEFSDVPYFGKPKVICYECGHAFTQEVTSYQARLEEYGYEIGREYILDILMREEEHWLDGLLKNLNVAEKVDNVVRSLTAQAARFKSQIKKKENEEGEGEGEEVVVDPKKEKEKERAMAKEREKEVNRQLAYEDKIRLLRKEIEDSHFGKPICLKCFSARQKLTHHETKVVFANEPAKIAKRKAHLGAMPIQNLKDPLHDLDQPLGRWECPDQNAITGFKGVHRIPPKNPEGEEKYLMLEIPCSWDSRRLPAARCSDRLPSPDPSFSYCGLSSLPIPPRRTPLCDSCLVPLPSLTAQASTSTRSTEASTPSTHACPLVPTARGTWACSSPTT